MTRHLFVYGTLMHAAAASRLGAEQRARLAAAGVWRGPATLAGRLLDKGSYPMLVAPTDHGDVVHGEVYELEAPDAVFRWLDPYEGIPAGRTEGDEYARVSRRARLADGTEVAVWVYVCAAAPAGLPEVPGGRWLPAAPQPIP